jgi:hypothetical protein
MCTLDNAQLSSAVFHIISNFPLTALLFEFSTNQLADSASHFINRLLQDSYNAGYSEFILPVGDKLIDALGWKIHGTAERNLNVTVMGNVADLFGWEVKHCNFKINGNVGDWCGKDAEYCDFTNIGNAGVHYGAGAKNCRFTLYGSFGHGCLENAAGCEIIALDKEMYDKMSRRAGPGNKVILKK